jgi:natural product precursor
MKKLKVKLNGIDQMSKEQMKRVVGGYDGDCIVWTSLSCGDPVWDDHCPAGWFCGQMIPGYPHSSYCYYIDAPC